MMGLSEVDTKEHSHGSLKAILQQSFYERHVYLSFPTLNPTCSAAAYALVRQCSDGNLVHLCFSIYCFV